MTTEQINNWNTTVRATTTDGWNVLSTPSPPLSAVGQLRLDDYSSLHWIDCYDDYCKTHRQMKDNNYYLCQNHCCRRWAQICDCPLPHPKELLEVTYEHHLNPAKANADWYRGKWVCSDCQFLVNMDNHYLCCSAAALREPLANITPPKEDQEAPAAIPTAMLQDEQLTLLGEIVTMIHKTTTQDTCHNHLVHRTLMQRMNDFHDADQLQLQRMTHTLGTSIAKQQ